MLTQTFAGDDVIANPSMIYDQMITISASAAAVWPWIVQLGKSRAGWYASNRVERFIPSSWRATRHIGPQWQNLAVGDRVPDYGFSNDDYFVVAELRAPHVLVYRSERYGCSFSWAILLLENILDGDAVETVVHLRFRGSIGSHGWKRAIIVWGGEKMDSWTTRPMLKGLKERVETAHVE